MANRSVNPDRQRGVIKVIFDPDLFNEANATPVNDNMAGLVAAATSQCEAG
jgi:hypothetical protein